ncbi:hypothetical protein CKA32_002343 [Geitlerinema sp. FC II]|nr:hypothetical protein CKA32_002343 [Geitlerinema sp. FC II]
MRAGWVIESSDRADTRFPFLGLTLAVWAARQQDDDTLGRSYRSR